MSWHEFARQNHKCYVSYLAYGPTWTVYLPDGTEFSDSSLDRVRDAARKQGCTIIL